MNLQQQIQHAVNIGTMESAFSVSLEKLAPLAKNCPGLKTFDYFNYLTCSRIRIARVLKALSRLLSDRFGPRPRILDFGSWLGNFSIAVSVFNPTWKVTAAEMWARYSPALQVQKNQIASHGIELIDTSISQGKIFNEQLRTHYYDAILFLAVIEHLSDTPKKILDTLYQALNPGGYLILDTPNLAYIANRRLLNRGHSPYVPIAEQFISEIPFEGHVREYTADELKWMLEATGFQVIETQFFNYSMFGVKHPYLMNARSIVPMLLDKTKREIIFMIGRKP